MRSLQYYLSTAFCGSIFMLLTLQLTAQSANKNALKAFEQAKASIKAGQLDEAEKTLIKTIELDHHWAEPQIMLGAIYFEKKDWIKSKQCFESVLQEDSLADPIIHFKLAEIAWKQENYSLVVSRINLFLKEDRIKPDIKAKAEKYLRDAEFLKSSVPEYATTIERLPA
ncbi:MAG: hypothetical protein KDC53_05455, partial [Saprospiraceae bacterium]|nr:hypothetical protein [Saprospiraceae bacterium]